MKDQEMLKRTEERRGRRFERRASEPTQQFAPNRLVHPVYLDVPMLVSFLAALEGGVSFEDQATRRLQSGASSDREVGARIGLPSLVSLFNVDMSGRLRTGDQEEASEESVAVRRHTEASLFNLLRARLDQSGVITQIQSPDDLDAVALGHLVEISGEVVGNPLQQMAMLVAQGASLMGLELEDLLGKSSKSKTQRARQQAGLDLDADAEHGLRVFLGFAVEVLHSTVRDVVLTTDSDLRAVLTLSNEFVTDQTEEYLRGSTFRVLAKVTRVVAVGDPPINLTRRSSMGLMDAEEVQGFMKTATESFESPLSVEIVDPLVGAPAIQLLPLAVFV